jgi:hypothetical protein
MTRAPEPSRRGPAPRRRALAVLALLAALALRGAPVAGESDEDRRSQAGVRLFRSLLAADLDIAKKTDGDGKLLLVVYHTGDRSRAEAVLRSLAGDGKDEPDPVRELPVRLDTTIDPTFAAFAHGPPAGIFLAQPPSQASLKSIVRYGIDHHVIVYSPFEGDVERGVLAGLSVEAQVRPYVNTDTLAASHISLKSFFMKVAKVYP